MNVAHFSGHVPAPRFDSIPFSIACSHLLSDHLLIRTVQCGVVNAKNFCLTSLDGSCLGAVLADDNCPCPRCLCIVDAPRSSSAFCLLDDRRRRQWQWQWWCWQFGGAQGDCDRFRRQSERDSANCRLSASPSFSPPLVRRVISLKL